MREKSTVTVVLQDKDRSLLETLARQDGDASMSAILRRLVREEARRRGIYREAVIDADRPADALCVA